MSIESIQTKIPKELMEIATTSDTPIYIVGGFVRNHLAGLGQTDIDICGAKAACDLVLPKGASVIPVHKLLGTALIVYGQEQYEYTPFRTEAYDKGGVHLPSQVSFVEDIQKDCLRRDFACNAVYYDIAKDAYLDFCGGIEDCAKRRVRQIHNKVFESDGLRLLRLVRQSVESGFAIEPLTRWAAKKNKDLLADISPERIRQELDKILSADQKYGQKDAHAKGLALLRQLGLFAHIVPLLQEGEDALVQKALNACKAAPLQVGLVEQKMTPLSLRLATLFHNLGQMDKVRDEHGVLGAEGVYQSLHRRSAHLAMQTMKKLRYDNATIAKVQALIAWQGRGLADCKKGDTVLVESECVWFCAKNFAQMGELFYTQQAIFEGNGCTSLSDELPKGTAPIFESKIKQVTQWLVKSKAPLSLQALAIDGQDCKRLGLLGKEIGQALEALWEWCVLKPGRNTKQALTQRLQEILGQLSKDKKSF
ncbi:MAG: hypothetical protein FWD76_03680 [Firmicutes bacterium]|nr:hypothetical protein [Bacillota bacterium]